MLRVLVLSACVIAVTRGGVVSPNIVGGQNAQVGQFPYQVSIRVATSNQHFCGGSIISRTKILTAAHCIHGNSQLLTVVAGSISLNTPIGILVIYSVPHPNYDPQTTINDVGVLTLVSPLIYVPTIQKVPLSSANPTPGSQLTLSGWGLTSYPGSISTTLQYIHLQALDLQTCAEQLQGANPITNGHVCTTSPVNQGSCQGDSGGPLVNHNGEQVGILSWGIPCAKGMPDVFTSVAFYRDWILRQ